TIEPSSGLRYPKFLSAFATSYMSNHNCDSEEDKSVNPQPRVVLPSEVWILIFKLAAGEPFSAFDTSSLPIMSSETRAWTHDSPPRPNNPFLFEASRAIYQEYMDRVRLRI